MTSNNTTFSTKVIHDLLVSSALNCGFIFDIQDSVENLITWKNPANTLLAMVVYINVSAENSVDYLKNMQNIQNLMGMISDGYDSVLPLIKYIDWSDEALTLRITRVVIIGLMVLSLVAWVIPWSYVFIIVKLEYDHFDDNVGGSSNNKTDDSKLKQKNSSYDDNEFILEKN
ncbi:9961_t:CDS:2 [Entrophospora sp. SA101]|nr:9961_t:CDS:2 [Entrophospora sp. SA101]